MCHAVAVRFAKVFSFPHPLPFVCLPKANNKPAEYRPGSTMTPPRPGSGSKARPSSIRRPCRRLQTVRPCESWVKAGSGQNRAFS